MDDLNNNKSNKGIFYDDLERDKEFIEVIEFIGRYCNAIRRSLRDEMLEACCKTMMLLPLHALKDENGRIIATTRINHYANTARIANKITRGISPENISFVQGLLNQNTDFVKVLADKNTDFAKGISTIALSHDLGHTPFGHCGEGAFDFALKQHCGCSFSHGASTAMRILYRCNKKIKDSINVFIVLDEEAERILKTEAEMSGNDLEGCNKKISELRKNEIREKLAKQVKDGKNPELEMRIFRQGQKNKNIEDRAIEIMAMAAGNHNGERGKAHIIPNLDRTFAEFKEDLLKTFIDFDNNKNMLSCNIADAITKLADQISSITLDIIDGKRGGIVKVIYEGWADPISKVLGVSEDKIKERLKGNNKELLKLVQELQDVFINDVIEHSNSREIKMSKDLEDLLYGLVNEHGELLKVGLRTYNFEHHTMLVISQEEEKLLYNTANELVNCLINTIVEKSESGINVFPPKLNEIFRLSGDNPTRRFSQDKLLEEFDKDEIYKDFYKYVLDTTMEEYTDIKKVVSESEVKFFRRIIEETLEKSVDIRDRNLGITPRGSPEYWIARYIASPSYQAMERGKNGQYSDDEIKKMLDRINAFKETHQKGRLKMGIPQVKYEDGLYGLEQIGTGKKFFDKDEQMASILAIGYLTSLNGEEFLDLAVSTGILEKEQVKKVFYRPYTPDEKPHATQKRT